MPVPDPQEGAVAVVAEGAKEPVDLEDDEDEEEEAEVAFACFLSKGRRWQQKQAGLPAPFELAQCLVVLMNKFE